MQEFLIVVPARLGSTRLPQKPLQLLCGSPLLVRVLENLAPLVEQGATLLVATDSEAVQSLCREHGYKSVMTSASHPSGSDRCLEAADLPDYRHLPFVVNIQCDEPFLCLPDLQHLLDRFSGLAGEYGAATLMHPNTSWSDFLDSNCVKVVTTGTSESMTSSERALYFSRAPIPWPRALGRSLSDAQRPKDQPEGWTGFAQHVGVYVYKRSVLRRFCQATQHPLETTERLEQLRLLGLGIPMLVTATSAATLGIDTPEDLKRAEQVWRQRQSQA